MRHTSWHAWMQCGLAEQLQDKEEGGQEGEDGGERRVHLNNLKKQFHIHFKLYR